jgi:uncharacterized membrane protein
MPCAMDIFALFVTIVGLSAWMGSAAFMSFFVSPAVHKKLSPGQAAELLDALQPRLHWLSLACAIFMSVGGITALFYPTLKTPTITFLGLTSLAVALSLYGGFVLVPRTTSLRDRLQSSAGSEMNFAMRERYDQATRLAIFLNLLVLLLLLGAAAALAAILGTTPAASANGK